MSDNRSLPDDDISETEEPASSVSLLYESGPCLAVFKPGGVLTQAPRGIDSLEIQVRCWLAERDAQQTRPYLGLPHRLDRPASGVVVMARHRRAARRLSEQFQGRMVGKRYWAIVEGKPAAPSGEWIDWLAKRPDEAHVDVVEPHAAGGKQARLKYRVISQTDRCSWLEIELETGRTHQIRVQAASRGHPILGDAQYGAAIPFGPQTEDLRLRWIALHGKSLRFRHPTTREWVEVEAPLPPPWQSFDPA